MQSKYSLKKEKFQCNGYSVTFGSQPDKYLQIVADQNNSYDALNSPLGYFKNFGVIRFYRNDKGEFRLRILLDVSHDWDFAKMGGYDGYASWIEQQNANRLLIESKSLGFSFNFLIILNPEIGDEGWDFDFIDAPTNELMGRVGSVSADHVISCLLASESICLGPAYCPEPYAEKKTVNKICIFELQGCADVLRERFALTFGDQVLKEMLARHGFKV